jgi:AraC-like DNA-binding protein
VISFVHRKFGDPDAYAEAVRLANASGFAVSERGIFNAIVDAVDLEGIWLQSGSDTLARTVHVELKEARRPLMFLAVEQVPPILLCGAEFGTDDIALFGQASSHFQRTFGPSHWATMSFPPESLEQAIRALVGGDSGDPSASQWAKPSSVHLTRLRQLHDAVIRMAGPDELALDHPEVMRSLKQSLTVAVVACLTEGNDQTRDRGSHRHQRIMRRFKEWLDANIDRPVYLQEICTALDVSAQTLRRCCEEHLRMSPMRYLWLRRMNLARHALQRNRSSASVTTVAMQFGFWHLGRFAIEYRSLFSETPSATLSAQNH